MSRQSLPFYLKECTPIACLETNAKTTCSSFTTTHFLPHGKGIEAQLADLKTTASLCVVQEETKGDPTKMNKMGTKTICVVAICNEHALIKLWGNVSNACAHRLWYDL